ncbi:MAG: HlyC/CorC family transporter [Lachnospiraceae bacterium]|nr:HlyC/CorC family transporter [Lachnospiraceae bacterium]
MSDKTHIESLPSKILSVFLGRNEEVTEEEILSMVNAGHEKGVLRTAEATMIQNIFSFADKDAKDIMVHRKDIVAIDGDSTLREAISFFEENPYSRFPVYLKDLDHIIGIIHLRDMFHYSSRSREYDKRIRDLEDLIRPAQLVPQTHGIDTLFTQMQHKKSHLAIVLDEYGQTSGIVSMEDILEEIVGNIQDEHDNEKDSIELLRDNVFRMNGHTTLEEVSARLPITFEEEDVSTLNGFIISRIDKIPEEHTSFSIDAYGYEFRVLDVEDKMVQDVIVRKIE